MARQYSVYTHYCSIAQGKGSKSTPIKKEIDGPQNALLPKEIVKFCCYYNYLVMSLNMQ